MELPVKDLDNSHRIGKSNSKNIKLDPSSLNLFFTMTSDRFLIIKNDLQHLLQDF